MPIRFDDYVLDEARYLLERSGKRVSLRPKVFDLLAFLVRHRDRVVRREELVTELWDRTAVGAGSLSGLVNELRQALGEDGRGPSSIRTVHARGYQFVARVREDESDGILGPVEASGSSAGVRTLIEQVSAQGVAGVVIESGPGGPFLEGTASELLRTAAQTGFEVHRIHAPDESQVSPSRFARQVLDSMLRHREPEAVRAALPLRARCWLEDALPERVAGGLSVLASGPPDPLGSVAAVLSSLSRKRPIVLLVEEALRAGHGFVRDVVSVRRRLAHEPVLFVITTGQPVGDASCLRMLEREGGFERWLPAAARPMALDRSLRRLGLPPLPPPLVDAIAAHVGGDERGLAAIVEWIAEVRSDGCGPPRTRANDPFADKATEPRDEPQASSDRTRVAGPGADRERTGPMRRVEPIGRTKGVGSIRS